MRTYPVLATLLLTLGCIAPIRTARPSSEKMPKGAAITLAVSQPDRVGLGFQLAQELGRAGFEVHSSSVMIGANPQFTTPYLCRVRTTGWGLQIRSFTLEIVHVESGRVLLTMNGTDGHFTAEEIVHQLLAELA